MRINVSPVRHQCEIFTANIAGMRCRVLWNRERGFKSSYIVRTPDSRFSYLGFSLGEVFDDIEFRYRKPEELVA